MNYLAVDIKDQFFGSGNVNQLSSVEGVGSLVTVFINGSLVVAGVIILFFLIAAGIGMISGAGQDDPQKMEQAKKTATSALIGFVIVFASYWIVQLLGEIIGINNIL